MAGYIGILQDASSPTPVSALFIIRQVLTPASVGANTTAEQTFTVPGVLVGDSLDVNKASHQVGLSIGNIRVTAPNTLAIQFVNTSGAAIVPTSELYIIGGQR
jgi:hypothetical protein